MSASPRRAEIFRRKDRRPLRKFAINYDYDLPDDLDKIKSKTNIAAIMRIISDKLAHDYKKLMIEDIQKRLEEKRLKRDSVQQVSTQLFLTSIDARNEFGDGNQQSGIELDR